MALNVPVGYFQIKLLWAALGDREEVISTIGVRPNAAGPRDLPAVAHAVEEAWIAAWPKITLNNNWQFIGAQASQGAVGGAITAEFVEEDGVGSHPDPCLPTNCAVLVKKLTGVGGRRNRGRMFLPAGYLPENSVDHLGHIDAAFRNAMQGRMDDFITNIGDATPGPGEVLADFQPVLFHNAPGAAPTDITQLIVDGTIATQRTRMR